MADGAIKIEELIEKPGVGKMPSNLAIVSGQVYTSEIFGALESVVVPEGEELVYIDGVNKLREDGRDAYAVEIKNGKYYDCGNVEQYLKTNVEMALKRWGNDSDFAKFIKETSTKIK
jgi:UTP--glucose-1-phosphate uridylyltransferase